MSLRIHVASMKTAIAVEMIRNADARKLMEGITLLLRLRAIVKAPVPIITDGQEGTKALSFDFTGMDSVIGYLLMSIIYEYIYIRICNESQLGLTNFLQFINHSFRHNYLGCGFNLSSLYIYDPAEYNNCFRHFYN